MNNCIFCKIAKKEIPSDIIYEDKDIIVFKDISNQAPIHFLFIPKKHIQSANFIDDDNIYYISEIFKKIPQIAKEYGFDKKGYRVVNNCNEDGGQSVNHIHFHLLAGRSLNWPPG